MMCGWAFFHSSLFPSISHISPTSLSHSHTQHTQSVKRGDRVAQLILERIVTPEVAEVADLDDTARGAGGYGSTGVAS
jgi:dUTPase